MAAVPTSPYAPRRPTELKAHGDVRVDNWHWLRKKDDPEVLSYLEAENAYVEKATASTAALRERLFEEIKGRVKEDDVSAPARDHDWWYWTKTAEGDEYGAHCRLADPKRSLDSKTALQAAREGHGEVFLDENALAKGHDFFELGVLDVTCDHRVLAYAVDYDGSEKYTLRFMDLSTGKELDDVVEEVTYGSAWATDNKTFFYVRPDEAMRPYEVWRHSLGTPASADVRVFHEPDERFFVSVGLTRSERYVLIHSGSKMTSEFSWIPADRPDRDPAVVLPRAQGVEYEVDHGVIDGEDVWLMRTNGPAPDGSPCPNFAVFAVPVHGEAGAQDTGGGTQTGVLVPHDQDVTVSAAEAFASHAVIFERADGLERIRIIDFGGDKGDKKQHVIAQPEEVYAVGGALNAEFKTDTFRFGYTSLVSPASAVDYRVDTRERTVIKTQPVLGGYKPEDYRTARLWATAPDGVKVPISVVASKDVALDGSAPCLLYGYGSYEINIEPTFSSARLNLLDRGFVFAIAHVRGGGEMGRRWYEEGRLEHKKNTFTDFIACAEHLLAEGWSSPERLTIRGGSAGGLLMGAVTNMRPDLWRAVVAEVPFVDVLTTMSDESLPLTVTEWEEWGDPVHDPAAYKTMKSYSPVDNVVPAAYPSMYVTAGLNDPRVGYWEPAKWVAKLRATRTDNTPLLLLKTELGAGHQGPSGRYEAWKDEARVQAYLIEAVAPGNTAP